ncbi:oxidoreductase [Aspergillus pseudoustus]|uniref:Oxidoreductase n=1 Tax=Aspergillus pseudoustus TaxID=1810923 RepID=A0ABR4JSG9_9EURO
MESTIGKPLTLSCGLQLKNRLVKAAMAECMADDNALPTSLHNNLYRTWGEGGWGMILTGNVQVDRMYLGDPRDTALDSTRAAEFVAKWRILSDGCTKAGSALIMQINHPGRQSPLGAGTRRFCESNIAPSPIPLDFGSGLLAKFASSFVFGTPREMTQADIDSVVKQFVDCSRFAYEAGLQGVEVHAAHGYLLAQFLSPRTNHRKDRYGGSPEARAQIITDIVRGIRAAVPASFCVGIKLNSVDHQSRETLAACVEQLKLIVAAGIDFIEISGGTYEDPQMLQSAGQAQKEKSSRTIAREAFFLEFASAIRHEILDVPLMVTGGFRSRTGLSAAIRDNACDLVGLGRPAVLRPDLPKSVILNETVTDEQALFQTSPIEPSWLLKKSGIKSAGTGAESKWYSSQMQRKGREAAVAPA